MTTGLLWFFLILLSSPWYANGRGIWSQLPRKRSSTTKSSPPTTSTFASSPSLPNDENQEIIRQLLQELFIVAEEFLTNTEFDSEEMFSMMQNLQWSFDEMRDLHSDGESDDQTENNPFLDENIDALRELFASLNTTNLRSKGLEFIAKGRESIDDIIDFLANPKKLIEYLQSLLSPEVFQQFQVLIPKTLPELKNFVNENFEIPADEFDEIIQPFQELIHEFSEILQNDGSFGNFDSPNAAAAGFNIIDEILDKEINFPNSPNDLGEDSIDDLLKIFHDPQKIENFRQMIIRNPKIAKEFLGVDETILARSEAFADYMNLFASEISSIMDPSQTRKGKPKSKKGKKTKKTFVTESFDA